MTLETSGGTTATVEIGWTFPVAPANVTSTTPPSAPAGT